MAGMALELERNTNQKGRNYIHENKDEGIQHYCVFNSLVRLGDMEHDQESFLVSFLVDARGGAMRGCRHSGVRVIVPPRKATMPMRVTCRYLKRDKLSHPPPLMEGEALASRILELGPVGAKFLGPVIIEVPHFGSLRGMEREIVILRSDNGETWREHTLEASDDAVHQVLNDSFEGEELSALEEVNAGRTTRILTTDFPQYFAVVSRIRQEVHAIGPEGGMVSSSVVPQVQAVFPQGALTKKIKVWTSEFFYKLKSLGEDVNLAPPTILQLPGDSSAGWGRGCGAGMASVFQSPRDVACGRKQTPSSGTDVGAPSVVAQAPMEPPQGGGECAPQRWAVETLSSCCFQKAPFLRVGSLARHDFPTITLFARVGPLSMGAEGCVGVSVTGPKMGEGAVLTDEGGDELFVCCLLRATDCGGEVVNCSSEGGCDCPTITPLDGTPFSVLHIQTDKTDKYRHKDVEFKFLRFTRKNLCFIYVMDVRVNVTLIEQCYKHGTTTYSRKREWEWVMATHIPLPQWCSSCLAQSVLLQSICKPGDDSMLKFTELHLTPT
uniref:ZU5 domain-containing protein n=1 Tax=Timema bartmani TaxID=61472 RepID=A0A7R9HYP0_9NEOP|nr:unnamed protein product [Timema bartmani]